MRALLLVALTGCDQLWNIDRLKLSDAGPDATDGSIDASTFDPARDCPIGYIDIVAGSRHRQVLGGNAWALKAECEADAPGLTHLAVVSSREEAAALETIVTERGVEHYVGAIQLRSATSLGAGWIWVTGGAVASNLWMVTPHTEPNDQDGIESDHVEQFAIIYPSYVGLGDYAGNLNLDGICECDGQATTDDANEAYEANR